MNPVKEINKNMLSKSVKRLNVNKNAPLSLSIRFTPSTISTDYEALIKIPDGRIIGRNVKNGNLVVIDQNYTLVQTLNSEGLFWLRSSALLLSTGTMLIYNRNKIFRSTDTTYTKFELVHSLRINCSILTDDGWDKSPDDVVMYGEYAVNEPRINPSDQKVWMGTDDGRVWKDVVTYNRNSQFSGDTEYVRHFHVAKYDKFTNRFWLCAGDGSDILGQERYSVQTENRIMTVKTDGTDLKLIGKGTQEWRVVGLGFTKDYVFWGTDGPMYYDGLNPSWSFYRYKRRIGALQRTLPYDMPSTIFGIHDAGDFFIGCGTAEPNANNMPAQLFVTSKDAPRWEIAAAIDGYDTYSRITNIVRVSDTRLLMFGENLTYNGINYVSFSIAYDIEVKSI